MADELTTWRQLIADELEYQGETWAEVVACTLSDAELDEPFDAGFGRLNGRPFTLWTRRRVYFPEGTS